MSKKQKTLFQAWNQGPQNKVFSTITLVDDLANQNEQPNCDTDFAQVSSTSSNNANVFPSNSEFDMDAGKTWIYPSNIPIRNYQFAIVKECLFKNTMVVLPTGLGKTLIAAVIMYNFYRWYPSGKVVFLAPTKPLVAQQRDACFNITGISQEDTVQMTGTNLPSERKHKWRTKRVFFLTPQTLSNDLTRNICSPSSIKCLVIDEAHKALGNHAYCEVIRQLLLYTSEFRVLALTATPGSDKEAIKQVISNLLISHVELRSEDSEDVKPYVYGRDIEKIVVPLGEELSTLKSNFLDIINVYLKRLQMNNAISAKNPATLSQFQVLKLREIFTKQPPNGIDRKTYGRIKGDFALCISLYHAYELLLNHGVRSFYNFLTGIIDGEKSTPHARSELKKSFDFEQMMQFIKDYFFAEGNTVHQENENNFLTSFSSSTQNNSDKLVRGHPKLKKLREIVTAHFKNNEVDPTTTRIIIFSQYRDSVKEIEEMLKQQSPVVRVMSFVGQASKSASSKGITQKQQLKVVQEFRDGGYNTLVSTCVGEEGLDIGEVDLIICYDCPKSPIRFVQRIGRTGRKRKGKIIFLVTEGKEEHVYKSSEHQRNSISRSLKAGFKFAEFYPNSPRMVPYGLNPTCVKSFMKIEQTKVITKSKPTKSYHKLSGFLDSEQKSYFDRHFSIPKYSAPLLPKSTFVTLPLKNYEISETTEGSKLSLNKWMPMQKVLQKTYMVSHSERTKLFVDMVQLISEPSVLQKYSFPTSIENMQPKQMNQLKTSVLDMLKSKIQSSTFELSKKEQPNIKHLEIETENVKNISSNKYDDSISIMCEKTKETAFSDFMDSVIPICQSTMEDSSEDEDIPLNDFSYLSDAKFLCSSFDKLVPVKSKNVRIEFIPFHLYQCNSNIERENSNLVNSSVFLQNQCELSRNNSVYVNDSATKCELNKSSKELNLSNEILRKPISSEIITTDDEIIPITPSPSSKKNKTEKEMVKKSGEKQTEEKRLSKNIDWDYINDSCSDNSAFNNFNSTPLFLEEFVIPETPNIVADLTSNTKLKINKDNSYNSKNSNCHYKMSNSLSETSNIEAKSETVSNANIPKIYSNIASTQPPLNIITQCSLTQLASLVDHTQKVQASSPKKSNSIELLDAEDIQMNSSSEEICSTPPKPAPSYSKVFTYKNNLAKSSQTFVNTSPKQNELDDETFIRDNDIFFKDEEDHLSFITRVTDAVENKDRTHCQKPEDILEVDGYHMNGEKSPKEISNLTFDLSFDINFTQEDPLLNSAKKTPIKPLSLNPKKIKITNEAVVKSNKITDKVKETSKRKQIICNYGNKDDDDDFQMPFKKPKVPSNPTKQKLKTPIKKIKPNVDVKEYLIQEAEVSDNDNEDDTDGSSLDELDESFIDDNIHNIPDTDQHLIYLKSIKNCIRPQNQFKLKYNSDVIDVYSQTVEDTAPDYIRDSFCVDDDDVVFVSSSDESKEENIDKSKRKKRKRIVTLDSNSSSDDTTPVKKMKINSPFRNNFPKRKKTAVITSSGDDSTPDKCRKVDTNVRFQKPMNGCHKDKLSQSTMTSKSAKQSINQQLAKSVPTNLATPTLIDLTKSPNISSISPKIVSNSLNYPQNNNYQKGQLQLKEASVDATSISFDISWDDLVEPVTNLSNKVNTSENLNVSDFSNAKLSSVNSTSEKSKKDVMYLKSEIMSRPKLNKVNLVSMNNSTSEIHSLHEKSHAFQNGVDKVITTSNSTSVISVPSPSVNCNNKKQIVILANTQELASNKTVISSLRTAQNAEVMVMQLMDADYIISNRMVILLVQVSDFFSAPNIAKIVKKVKAAKDLYEKCCTIIEKDTRSKSATRFNEDLNPHLEFSLTVLQNSSVKILHSESQQDSAKLLYELADGERKRNMHINVPVDLNEMQQQRYYFYISLPHISPICALNFVHNFTTVAKFFQASVEDLKTAGHIGSSRAHSIYWYLRANL